MKTITKTQSLRPLLAIKADDAGALPDRIEVLRTGMWDAPYHGSFMVTPQDIQQYIENFNNDVRPSSSTKGLPIDLDHDAGAAAGWMTALSALPNDDGGWSLWADVKWTDLGQEKLLGGQYAFFSPEFCPQGYLDPEGDDEPLDNVLIGGGLTNRPLFKELQPVMASDKSKGQAQNTQFNKMFISASEEKTVPTLDEVRVKDVADLTDEDKQVLADNKDQLSQEEASKFEAALPAPTTPETTTPETQPTAPAEGEAPAAGGQDTNNNEETTTVSANDKSNVVISASELESLKAAAAQGVAANERLKLKETQDHIDSKIFSASDGFKLKQDMRDSVVELYLGANDSQKEVLDKVFDAMSPIKTANEMGAMGSSQDAASGSSYKMLNEKAEEIVSASDGKKTYTDAMLQARRENPELAASFDAEIDAGRPVVTK